MTFLPTDPELVAALESASQDILDRWAVRVATLVEQGIERVSAERIALQELQSENSIDLFGDAPQKTDGTC